MRASSAQAQGLRTGSRATRFTSAGQVRCCETKAISHSHSNSSTPPSRNSNRAQPEARALDPKGFHLHGHEDALRSSGIQYEHALEVTRRSGMVSALALGSAAAWLALCGGNVADNQAIEQVVANVPFEDARFACADASGVCSTLYSQMASTLRQLTTGYIPDDTFQAACKRRLSSPYIQESMISLEESLPVVGASLSYSPDLAGSGWLLNAAGRPRVNQEARERFEGMTLRALQRCRRVQRLSVAMNQNKFTPAAVQLLTQDLKELSRILEEMLGEVSRLERRARAAN